MGKPKASEKLLLDSIVRCSTALLAVQRHLSLGQLVSLVRRQLGMPQRVLGDRAKVSRSTAGRLESGRLEPNMATLKKVADALSCDLLVTLVPRDDLGVIRRRQAATQARKRIAYLQGTMSLEDQEPDPELLEALTDEEISRLLGSGGRKLWEDEF